MRKSTTAARIGDKLFARVLPEWVAPVRQDHTRTSSVRAWNRGRAGACGMATAGSRTWNAPREGGCIAGADDEKISNKAVERGYKQIGTLVRATTIWKSRSSNPVNIFDVELARTFGHHNAQPGGGDVSLRQIEDLPSVRHRLSAVVPQVMEKEIRENQDLGPRIACAPFQSPEGQDYFAAMKCAINIHIMQSAR